MVEERPATALILGAGFSAAAGLPLASGLFDTSVLVASAGARKRFARVRDSFQRWKATRVDNGPEQYLGALYSGEVRGPPWQWAVEFVGATLATPQGKDWPIASNPRYAGRITTPVRTVAHDQFWSHMLAYADLQAVVTFNYDLFIERGLRHRQMHRGRPGIYYGGLPRPQVLRGLAKPFTVQRPERSITLEGTIPLFKLHGSLNWSFERGSLEMYQDARPAFRHGGSAAIIPPLPEKEVPRWLTNTWREAEDRLRNSRTWVVCGYSLPPYDHAAAELLGRAATSLNRLFVLDPYSAQLRERWAQIAPHAQLQCLQGIPEALGHRFL